MEEACDFLPAKSSQVQCWLLNAANDDLLIQVDNEFFLYNQYSEYDTNKYQYLTTRPSGGSHSFYNSIPVNKYYKYNKNDKYKNTFNLISFKSDWYSLDKFIFDATQDIFA